MQAPHSVQRRDASAESRSDDDDVVFKVVHDGSLGWRPGDCYLSVTSYR
jgi:hypothetical protein